MLWRVNVTAIGGGSRESVAAVQAATMRRKGNCEGYPPSFASSQLLCFRNSMALFEAQMPSSAKPVLFSAAHIRMAFEPVGTIMEGNSRPSSCGAVGSGSWASFAHGLAPASLPCKTHLPAFPLRLPLTLSCYQLETQVIPFALPSLPLGRDCSPAWMYAS